MDHSSKVEISDPNQCRLIPYLKKCRLSLSPINQKCGTVSNKLKVKPFLENIFKNVYIQVNHGGFVDAKGKKNPLYDLSINWEIFRKS